MDQASPGCGELPQQVLAEGWGWRRLALELGLRPWEWCAEDLRFAEKIFEKQRVA